MSEVKVNKISPRSGTAITLGDSGDTFTIPSGATLAIAGSVTGFTSAGIDDNATSVAITIDSSERVMIGTTDIGYANAADNLTIGSASGNTGITIRSGTSNNSNIYFSDATGTGGGTFAGALFYQHSDNAMVFYGNSLERMRITSVGLVGIGTSTPKEKLDSRGASVISGDHATATNAYGTAHGILLSSTPNLGKITAISNGSNDVKLELRGLDGGSANSNQLVLDGGTSNVGIGTSSPSARLNVSTASSGVAPNSFADDLFVENSGHTGITIGSGSSHLSSIYFANSSDNDIGKIEVDHAAGQMRFHNNGSERARIDASGNFGIGTTSPSQLLQVNGHIASNGLHFVNNTTSPPSGATIHQPASNVMAFRTNNNERMRITDGGTVFVSNTSEPSGGDNGAQISNGSYHIFARNTSVSSVFRTFGSSGEFRTLGNGNAQNTNNSYGAISDRVLKENEVDASSQWNDIKALQIKHYNFKSKPNEKQLGVIAQDLEASGMNGLVENNQDELYTEDDVLPEGKNIGDVRLKNYKSVKYSILYMKSVKALQEAMERIETLEAKVTALETTTP